MDTQKKDSQALPRKLSEAETILQFLAKPTNLNVEEGRFIRAFLAERALNTVQDVLEQVEAAK